MIRKNSKSILIVNGDPDISDLLAEMLLMGDETYILNTASTGKECLMAMKRNRTDLVLMDIELSDILGWDLVEKIKKDPKDIPVIIITSKPPAFDDFTRLSMVSDYLMKPVTLDGLLMAVKDALELPLLLERCMKNLKKCMDDEEAMYLFFLLLKQNTCDRKQYVLMRQLYSDRSSGTNEETKLMLDKLRGKINNAQNEINYLKDSKILFA